MRLSLALAALAFSLAACDRPTPPPPPAPAASEAPAALPPPASPDDPCGAKANASLIGQNIAAITLPVGVRVLAPDTIRTDDFRPERLNVMIDKNGIVTELKCF